MRSFVVIILIFGIFALACAETLTICKGKTLYEPVPVDAKDNEYDICVDELGKPIHVICPSPLKFNADTKGCSTQASTPGGSAEVCPPTPPAGTTCTAAQVYSPIKAACVDKNDWYCGSDGPDCDNVDYQNRRLFDKYDCTSFYECIEDIRVKGKCSTGQKFNPDTGLCSTSKDVVCQTLSSASGSALEPITDICKGVSSAKPFVADPNYCMGYYYCKDEKTPYWGYCGTGMYFNDGFCSSERSLTCKCEGLNYDTVTKQLVPHKDQNKFYVCKADTPPDEKSCPSGTVFKPDLKSCAQA